MGQPILAAAGFQPALSTGYNLTEEHPKMRSMPTLLLLLATAAIAQAQSATAPTFEVASVKTSPPSDGRGTRVGCNGGPGSDEPGRITCTNLNLANLVTMAYGIAHYQLSGISLADSARFELAVKLPEGATKDQVKLMWQNLLAERFKLTVRHETKDVPGYELLVAKGGPKMKEWVEDPPSTTEGQPPARPDGPPKFQLDRDGFPVLPPGRAPGMIMESGKARWRAAKETMQQLASMLAVQLGQPVTDATGLAGKYEFTLSWATDSFGARRATTGPAEGAAPAASLPEPDTAPTLIMAIQSQLGLKLEQKKVPMEFVVVDHVEKTPTEN